ncbi:hypothetical protein F7725_015722, partial [Dissostichus mawsoni]
RNELVDNSFWCPVPVRRRSPGDEDGAHQRIYQVGQLFSVAEASKNETGGGEGIENEYMKDDFMIKIETWHKPDMGTIENVHDLDEPTWRTVEVSPIDIASKEEVAPGDYKPEEDPTLFHSAKTGRGPLGPEWKNELKTDCPYMCAYKLVTVKFKWWGLQTKVENFIHRQEKRIFTNFHRQLFCWIDRWVGLTMEDIRRMEEETQKELEELRKTGPIRGTSAAHDE